MIDAVDNPILPAWQDPVHDAQNVFRLALQALSEPGTIMTLSLDLPVPESLDMAATALCLTFLDMDTPLWIDHPSHAAQTYLRFHCGCPLIADCAGANFALLTDAAALRLDRFAQGSMTYPDRSATLIVQVTGLTAGPTRVLTGPGIAISSTLHVSGLPQDFSRQWAANHAAFPCGVDVIFCCGAQFVALPRSTMVRDIATITTESTPCM